MKLYLLRWNPAISSFPSKEFDRGFSMLRKGMCPLIDWSVREPEKLEFGDWGILCRVGGDADGIVALGRFRSAPRPGESWRKDGTTIFYADIEIEMSQKPEKTGMLDAKALQSICPEIDWHKGSSGILIAQDVAERLALHLAEKLLILKDQKPKTAFAVNPENGAEFPLVCGMLSQLCPKLLADLKRKQKAIDAMELARIPDYLDEIAYDEAAVSAGKPLLESLQLLSWEGTYPFDNRQLQSDLKTMKDEYAAIVSLLEDENQKNLPELPDYWEKSPAIKAEIELFSRDLQETIDFLDHDITPEQFVWMSEVFEEISAKLQSWAFIDALQRTADRYQKECDGYCIQPSFEFAIGQLSDKVYRERFPDADFGEQSR